MTLHEIATIRILWNDGLSIEEIAYSLDRLPSEVYEVVEGF